MNNDIAGVVSSEPTTTIEIGSVASAGSSASTAPARPGHDDVDRELRAQHGVREHEHGDIALRPAVDACGGGVGLIGVLMAIGHAGGAPG